MASFLSFFIHKNLQFSKHHCRRTHLKKISTNPKFIELSIEFDRLEDVNRTLNGRVDTLQGEVDDLKKENASLKDNISKLQANVKRNFGLILECPCNGSSMTMQCGPGHGCCG